MKKVLILCTCLMLFLVGCAKSNPLEGKENELVDSLLKIDDLNKLEKFKEYDLFFDVEKDVKVLYYVKNSVQQFAIFTCKDSEQTDRTLKIVKDFVDNQIKTYEPYPDPANSVGTLKNAIITTKGNCVVLCVTNDTKKALEAIDKYSN